MNFINHPRILVVEDDDSVRRTLVDILELNGYEALVAEDGVEGLGLARSEEPNLIITDIAMPGLSGFELLQQFRRDENLRGIPVIVVSAKAERASVRRGMELGADDFITKPFAEEEVLHSIKARLEKKELLDELNAFAHTVAHDLKNPLATLRGRLELMEMVLDKSDEATLRNHLAEAVGSAQRLSELIDGLLVLAGVRRQSHAPEPLDMAAAVRESLDRLEDLIRRTGARVVTPESWLPAAGNQPWVVDVWANYISNAAKYAGPEALITLGSEPREHGRRIRFWVRDRGPGLDAAAQAALFVPFTRIAAGAGGHGLGLSIVRRIVEKLDGQVGVESAPGQGACFWFELPALRQPAGIRPRCDENPGH